MRTDTIMHPTISTDIMGKMRMTKLINAVIEKNKLKSVLDVGCGHGYFELRFPNIVTGLDIDKDKLERMKQKGIRNIRHGNAKKLPFKDGAFDGVILKDVLEHFYVEDTFKVIDEATRVLKKGGFFIATSIKNTQGFWDAPDHIRPCSNNWIKRVCIEEFGKYELAMTRDFLPGIPGVGLLHLERLAEIVAKALPFLSTHGLIVLKKK